MWYKTLNSFANAANHIIAWILHAPMTSGAKSRAVHEDEESHKTSIAITLIIIVEMDLCLNKTSNNLGNSIS